MDEKPNRLKSAGKWSVGAVAGGVIFAAQTRPEDAGSSMAAWLHAFGVDQVPSVLASTSADTWATLFAAPILLVLAWRTYQKKRRGMSPDDLDIEIVPARPASEADQLAQRRRELIAEGRRIVAEYDHDSGADDRAYLLAQPAFLRLRKYLSPDYLDVLNSTADASYTLSGNRLSRTLITSLAEELDRLETEWGLDLLGPRAPVALPSRSDGDPNDPEEVWRTVERIAERSAEALRGPFGTVQDSIRRGALGRPPVSAKRRRDTTVSEALAYAALGRWGESFMEVPLHYAEWNAGKPFVEQFQKAARDGALTVWGKQGVGTVYEEIPTTYWREHGLDVQSIMMGRAATVPMVEMEATALFSDLMVNREEVERTWPHAG